MPRQLDFWFDFASTYSYIAALRVEPLCEAAGLTINYKPFLLGPIFVEQLGIKYSLPWRRPTTFPRNSILAARVACTGADEAWGAQFIRTAFLANFAEDRDIADPLTLGAILEALQLPSAEILERAVSSENKLRLRDQTTQASALGMFGAPNFVVAGEMFFGQDRLEDAIHWALSH